MNFNSNYYYNVETYSIIIQYTLLIIIIIIILNLKMEPYENCPKLANVFYILSTLRALSEEKENLAMQSTSSNSKVS